MALKFLSKKKWHVRRLENIRKVAEAEAKLAEEQTRMAELRREREEEREIENIRKIQEASGRIPKQQPRLEFLYKAPPVKKQSEEDIITTEDILRGRRPDSILFNKLDKKRVELALPGVKYIYSQELGKSDSNLKMREDPITGIIAKRKKKKQEQEEREAMLKKIQEVNRMQNNNYGSLSYNNKIPKTHNTSNSTDSIDTSSISKPNLVPPQDDIKMKSTEKQIDNGNHDPTQNEIDEETQRISAQMEAFEKKQKIRKRHESSDSDDYSDEYERRRKHSSGHRHHHRHHRRHHRQSNYSDYD